ncbi:mechanosensitive ion channel family protein [Compostimonas suwonensis]|uniref:Small conductance mechanosensitive channel n=1 Tax=Compostimonas suwonensis TaxID=1048394 RepID=A0A2M9BZK0_9MICO|nr:mechanosensitive ion channel family protein [Compostimonas suwonensis]PJJ63504.1 small conductance mechanosensitive channel [Compostimonas suwonensis]
MDWNSFWASVGQFFADRGGDLLAILGILVGAAIIRWILHFVVKRVVTQIVTGIKKTQRVDDTQSLQASPLAAVRVVQRTRTIGSVLNNVITWTIIVIALIMVLDTLGVSITALVASAGVIAAGLAFGAQNIVKDVLNGLFMVIEDQLGVGDVVDVGPATGVVEAVGIRITQVRDVNGTLWFVRNGEILRVGNMSQGWARVIIDLAVPYETDVEEVEAKLLKTAGELASSPKWRSTVLEKPEIWGLESISAEALVIRLVIKTRTTAKDEVARELRMRIKKSLDDMGVQLPALNSIVLSGYEGAASVRGSKPPRTKPVSVVENKAPRRAPRTPRKPEAE